MKKLNKNRKQLLLLGGMMMVVSAFAVVGSTLTLSEEPNFLQLVTIEFAPWIFFLGALLFSFVQRGLRPVVDSSHLAVNRLFRIQTFSHVLLILAGLLMIEHYNGFLLMIIPQTIESFQLYVQFVRNNWVVMMLIGAILQLYSVLRLNTELQKIGY